MYPNYDITGGVLPAALVGRVTGLGTQRVEIAMMVTPGGHSRLELSRFLTPPAVANYRHAPVNERLYIPENLAIIFGIARFPSCWMS